MNHTHLITWIADPEQAKLDAARLREAEDLVRAEGWKLLQTDWLSPEEACDFYVDAGVGMAPGAAWARSVAERLDSLDVIVQTAQTARKKKLLITDMDSTMITVECIDELADFVGLKKEVSIITDRAMNGELDFKEALIERVALLKDLNEAVLEKAYNERVQFMPGGKELVATMRANGATCWLVSGGFTYFTNRVRDALGFHHDQANRLALKDGKLTGKVVHPILDKEAKLQALQQASSKLGISPRDAVAVGDGANDLPMLQAAGLGIAYHAKPVVRAVANANLNVANLRGVLFAQGYRSEEIIQ